MSEHGSTHREEIFAFGIESPDETFPRVPLADDQDPATLTEAGIVAARTASLVERAHVGGRMAAHRHVLRWDELWEGTDEPYHRRAIPAPFPPRDVERLDRIAARMLLGRARTGLAADPEVAAVAGAMRGEPGRTA